MNILIEIRVLFLLLGWRPEEKNVARKKSVIPMIDPRSIFQCSLLDFNASFNLGNCTRRMVTHGTIKGVSKLRFPWHNGV